MATDPRVAAVLAVLAGTPPALAAERWAVDPGLLGRWVDAFVAAGTAQVTNRPADDAARQRDRFLAAFAHEVRTPLTVAQGWVGLLEQGLPTAAAGDAVARTREALERLAERALDVELLAAASLGRLRPHLREVTLGEVVSGLPVPVTPASAAQPLTVDPDLLRRVVRDLWQAGWLPPTPQAVRLDAAEVGPWVELRVVRDGGPVDVALLQALFEPFDMDEEAGEVTIGLYLARALTVAHGGTLGVDQDDAGATFWVRVPQAPALARDLQEDR